MKFTQQYETLDTHCLYPKNEQVWRLVDLFSETDDSSTGDEIRLNQGAQAEVKVVKLAEQLQLKGMAKLENEDKEKLSASEILFIKKFTLPPIANDDKMIVLDNEIAAMLHMKKSRVIPRFVACVKQDESGGYTEDPVFYIGMEAIRGYALNDPVFLKKVVQKGVGAMTYWLKVLEAIKELHKNGIVHGDIKLDNLMFDETLNRFRLIDMGCAEAESVEPGVPCGTPFYMSPAKMAVYPADPIDDIYAWVILIFMGHASTPNMMNKSSGDNCSVENSELQLSSKYDHKDEVIVPISNSCFMTVRTQKCKEWIVKNVMRVFRLAGFGRYTPSSSARDYENFTSLFVDIIRFDKETLSYDVILEELQRLVTQENKMLGPNEQIEVRSGIFKLEMVNPENLFRHGLDQQTQLGKSNLKNSLPGFSSLGAESKLDNSNIGLESKLDNSSLGAESKIRTISNNEGEKKPRRAAYFSEPNSPITILDDEKEDRFFNNEEELGRSFQVFSKSQLQEEEKLGAIEEYGLSMDSNIKKLSNDSFEYGLSKFGLESKVTPRNDEPVIKKLEPSQPQKRLDSVSKGLDRKTSIRKSNSKKDLLTERSPKFQKKPSIGTKESSSGSSDGKKVMYIRQLKNIPKWDNMMAKRLNKKPLQVRKSPNKVIQENQNDYGMYPNYLNRFNSHKDLEQKLPRIGSNPNINSPNVFERLSANKSPRRLQASKNQEARQTFKSPNVKGQVTSPKNNGQAHNSPRLNDYGWNVHSPKQGLNSRKII